MSTLGFPSVDISMISYETGYMSVLVLHKMSHSIYFVILLKK